MLRSTKLAMRTTVFRAVWCLVLAWAASTAYGFDGIRLTLLGTGLLPALPDRVGPSTLLEAGEDVLLFDCGEGTTSRLKQAGVPLRDLTALFLTSLDQDRVSGCTELWRARAQSRDVAPLAIWGPSGTHELVRKLDRETAATVTSDAALQASAASEISENLVFQTDDLSVTAFVVDYAAVAEAYGYRIDYRGRSVALSGATRYSANLIVSVRNVQVLLHEVAAADPQLLEQSPELRGRIMAHTSPEEAGKVFRAARPYLAVLSQVILLGTSEADVMRRIRAHYPGALEMGRDLLIVEVENEVQLRGSPSNGRRDTR
jgi:ribonuclease Z